MTIRDFEGTQADIYSSTYIDDTALVLGDVQICKIIETTRLGIHQHRDAHLMYRFIDFEHSKYCTSTPLTKKRYIEGIDYKVLT